MSATPIVLVLLGPTGSGKTQAIQELGLDPKKYEILSCDSRQIYEGLEMTTAAPEVEFQKFIKHHLVSIVKPNEAFSAGDFFRRASRIINELHHKNKIPVIVGGSGFYYRALETGLFPITVSNEIRESVSAWSAEERLEKLKQLDSDIVTFCTNEKVMIGDSHPIPKIHVNDVYRIQRALEIILTNNKKLSTIWQEMKTSKKERQVTYKGFYFQLEKEEHDQMIKERVKKMIQMGIVDEVGKVYKEYGVCKILNSSGIREILEVYHGNIKINVLHENLSQAHRQIAKKQRTWLRKEKGLQGVSPKKFIQEWQNIFEGIHGLRK